jgi:phosphopantothenoylcysteine synthetase/decarboxylase
MWNASVTKSNIVKLESRQWIVINPSYGKLACNTTGDGKLASTETIVKFITEILK